MEPNLSLIYNEMLDENSVPNKQNYSILINGNKLIHPNTINVTTKSVILQLPYTVEPDDNVKISYAALINPIRDLNCIPALPLVLKPVVNKTIPEIQAPVIVSACANGQTITLIYSQELKEEPLPDITSFVITVTGQEPFNPVQVSITGNQVVLSMDQALQARDTLTIIYTPGENPIQDHEGHLAAALTAYPVDNHTEGDIIPPQLQDAVINGQNISLLYDELLDANAVPDVSDFTVYMDQVTQLPRRVELNQKSVIVSMETAAKEGLSCYLDYNPGTHPISDQSGNPASALQMQPLNNATDTLEAPALDPVYPSSLEEATSFIYEGEDPVQTGVDPATIVADRVFLIRGKVNDRDGIGLAGVKISIANHSEFGETTSRSDGAYDLVVNGGGLLTVSFEKDNYITAQRVIESAWEQIKCLDDVVLLAYDSKPSPISLENIESQVVQGSISADKDGERQATLIIPAGTSAQMQLQDGSTAPLTTATIRATEITVGENGPNAMPAELPGNVGYTYAVDFSVDEARNSGTDQVSFDRPIYNYVERTLSEPRLVFIIPVTVCPAIRQY
jgi:uncharacterized repeat protein (TIGR02059 family)